MKSRYIEPIGEIWIFANILLENGPKYDLIWLLGNIWGHCELFSIRPHFQQFIIFINFGAGMNDNMTWYDF